VGFVEAWIPACAGMTIIKIFRMSLAKNAAPP